MEHLDVLIVGAGLSGIGAAHHIHTECPWAEYAVLESRGVIGGTWDLFRYPGVRSDSEMHTLGYSFRPWAGEKSIADGDSILDYIRDTADTTGVTPKIRFHHRVVNADWDSAQALWRVTAQRIRQDASDGDVPAEGFDPDARDEAGKPLVETVEFTCWFLFSCTGYYRYDHGHLPDFPGMEDFTGELIHPQFWPPDFDATGKRVVVIGSGATAVTLVPALAHEADHVTMVQRSPTYMAVVPSINPIATIARRRLPERVWGPGLKWLNALTTQTSYNLSRRYPKFMGRALRKGVALQLPEDFDVERHFTPKYDPWDQRLCAVTDGDLFASLGDGSASIVTDTIERFTGDGIRLDSGETLQADVVVSATGLDLLFMGGMDLTVDGEQVDPAERLAYKGMMLEGVPNAAMAVGYTNASWTLKADLISEYVCRMLNHMRDRGLRQCTALNHDDSIERAPLLDLSSGYVQRSTDRFPSQGLRGPWRMNQSYLTDVKVMRPDSVHDSAMVFSNPDPNHSGHPLGAEVRLGGSSGRLRTRLAGRRTPPLPDLADRVAAVTGAGSGIGRALAIELARRGCHLALADIDEPGLAETVTLCEGTGADSGIATGVKVTSRMLDVADREGVFAWADEVVADHGCVNLIINNAGVAVASTVGTTDIEDFEWLMSINFWGVVHGTDAFLPKLREAGAGHVVNLSSVFGLISIPTQSAYNSSKFAVRGFTDALRIELEIADCGVSSTTVHPGGIRTNIARNARSNSSIEAFGATATDLGVEFDKIARTSPHDAALKILEGVTRNRRRVLVGPDAVGIDLISRLPARLYQGILVRGARLRG